MNRLLRLFSTSIGRKLVMAVSGLILFGWLVAHMLGNMALYQGPAGLNSYAAWLQGHPSLWFIRLFMLFVLGLHVYVALVLALENRAARSTGYATPTFQTSWESRYMVITGSLVVIFLVYHILHFTLGAVASEYFGGIDPDGHHDVYSMVVRSFQDPLLAGSYIVAMLLIGTHLIHASRSMFQTVGINHESYNGSIRLISQIVVALFVLGNCSMPILVLAGVVGLDAR